MQQRCADPSFGLNGQALAVLQLLAYREPEFAVFDEGLRRYQVRIQTFPWYNGRERGICLMVQRDLASPSIEEGQDPALFLAIGECRLTDRIFVEKWEQCYLFNGVTIEDRWKALGDVEAEEVQDQRRTFTEGQIGLAADYCYDQMGEWYKPLEDIS